MKFLRRTALIVILGWAWIGVTSVEGAAQSSGSGDSSSARAGDAGKKAQDPEGGNSSSEEEQFEHSPSVQFIAKHTGLSVDQAYWLSVCLNFAIIAGVVIWGMKKNLPGMFRSRTESIQRAMLEARKAGEDAQRRLGEIETRLSRLGAEMAQVSAKAEKDVAGEESRIRAEAVEAARKVVTAAEQEIAAAAKVARRQLTTYAADLALGLAAKQMHVDDRTDQGLVANFAQQMAARDNNSDERKGES